MKNEETKSTTIVVTKVNNVSILVGKTAEKLVPIKPICQALGIDDKAQKNRIERDEILNSVRVMATSTGTDGKGYDMLHLPLQYALGWLFSIDHNSVNEVSKPTVLKFKKECYDALFNHFVLKEQYLEWQNMELNRLYEDLNNIKDDFKYCKTRLKDKQEEIATIRQTSFEDWRTVQTTINFAPAQPAQETSTTQTMEE